MGTATFAQEFKDGLEFTPVDGQSNLFVIRLPHVPGEVTHEKMTSEDWDKFEKNIKELRVR